MKGHLITLSKQEWERKRILDLVQDGHINLEEAARRMNVSYRQTLRVYQRYQRNGAQGLAHGNRGRSSGRAHLESFKKKVLARYRERYEKFELGPTLASEKLAKDGLDVDHDTLRLWLIKAGLWKKKPRKNKHRARRERKHHFGELVQLDGSHHKWFGEDRDKACLMNMVDDATGDTLGWLDLEETTDAAMHTLRLWVEKYGIPLALYTDRAAVYIAKRQPTIEEQLDNTQPLTHFGKACEKLGIDIIAAQSPQAKGRVERSNGTYQNRFVKELALCGIKNIDTANKLLTESFADDLNTKFGHTPLSDEDYHRPVPKGLDLDDVFCYEYTRVVQNDFTVSFESQHYQIHAINKNLPRPKTKVTFRVHLDKRVQILHKGKCLHYTKIGKTELRQRHSTKKTPQKEHKQKVVPKRPTKHTGIRPVRTPSVGRVLARFNEKR